MWIACWALLTVVAEEPSQQESCPACEVCQQQIPRWWRAPLAHWYQYRMGCGSACRHCQSTRRDWVFPEFDYHNRLDYPWFSLRRTTDDLPERLWPVEQRVQVPGKRPTPGKPKPVLGPGPWGWWAPPFLYDPRVQVRY